MDGTPSWPSPPNCRALGSSRPSPIFLPQLQAAVHFPIGPHHPQLPEGVLQLLDLRTAIACGPCFVAPLVTSPCPPQRCCPLTFSFSPCRSLAMPCSADTRCWRSVSTLVMLSWPGGMRCHQGLAPAATKPHLQVLPLRNPLQFNGENATHWAEPPDPHHHHP